MSTTDSTYGYRNHFGSFIQTTVSEGGTKWNFWYYFFLNRTDRWNSETKYVHRKAFALIYNFSVKGRTVPLCRCPEAGWDTRCLGDPDTQVSGPKQSFVRLWLGVTCHIHQWLDKTSSNGTCSRSSDPWQVPVSRLDIVKWQRTEHGKYLSIGKSSQSKLSSYTYFIVLHVSAHIQLHHLAWKH